MADVALRAPGASASPPTARGQGGADRVERHPLVFDQLRIENTNHCGYRCFMCPREQQTRASGFMPIEDLAFVYERIGPDHEGEIHLHGFGEPLLDKRLIDKVALTRARYPKAFIKFFTTLGVKVEDGTFERLARAGISNLQISFYGFTAESYAKVTGTRTFELARANLEALAQARRTTGTRFTITLQTWEDKVWQKWPEEAKRARRQFLLWTQSLGIGRHEVGALHNYGSGRAYNKPPAEGLCSVAWGLRRRVLQVTWDLKVIPCCFDFDASVVLGDLRTQTLRDVFDGEPYRRFLVAHLDNRLDDYPVCQACERCFQP
jgi:hypothetical protein